MARTIPDTYEETRRRLNIPNILQDHTPGEPLLVRAARKVDGKLRQVPLLPALAKAALRPVRKIKQQSSKFIARTSNKLRPEPISSSSKVIVLPSAKKPYVSIIIPVFNKVDTTLACLASFGVLETKYEYEVVISDNASTDKTFEKISRIANIVYVRNKENLGFVGGCNVGAENARGEILVFLNNDTLITKDWLDELLLPFTEDPEVGLVGSKLLYPDGSLQEAGGIIFNDASGMNYGKYQNADYFQFNYRREVDYCSGASVAIPTALFRNFGGFDNLYSPAYYEDTDLAFKVRDRGLKVIYQPTSVAYHIEGKTAGTSTNSGFKRFQAINHVKFLKRWKTTLNSEHNVPEEWYIARDRSGDKLALIIDDKVPTPDMDSGSQRMVRLIEDFQQLGYKVTFWPVDMVYKDKYVKQLQAQGVEVVYGSVDFRAFATQFGRYYDTVILSRPYVAAKFIEACRAWFYKAKIVYDTVDLHFIRTERQAALDTENSEGLLDQANGYRNLEIGIARRADVTLVVSDSERKVIERLDNQINVQVVSNIHQLDEAAYQVGFEDRKDLTFIGGFDHLPNQDAIAWFVESIFPLIQKRIPEIKLNVIGAKMPDSLKERLSRSNGVVVHGYVEDVSGLFKHSRIFVCPLRFGAGVKGKLGQAIEYGVPIVSTPIGTEGMKLHDNESCLISTEESDFANNVIRLYEDKDVWIKLQTNAKTVLEKHFSHASSIKGIKSALK